MAPYKVVLERKADADLAAMSPANRRRILRAIHERLTVDPAGVGKPLQHNLKGCWRLRVGEWRVLYRIDGNTVTVFVFAVANRSDVYKRR